MTETAERIKQELESLGYAPTIQNHGANYPCPVVIEYQVENGRFRNKKFYLGISMGNVEEGFPEYPPHFILLSPPIDSPRDGGIHGTYSVPGADGNGRPWVALSRPPGPFWDTLPTKSMKGYLDHIKRFWENV